ncbi:plastocyanin/azurin family copper-binding protein [Bradyrhizobium sp.]|jgi:plastocyanin|uniref:plastocyanin/azurin family copper-binding protein n=1 Tax=Bradyrhizobium sp. TaxID=376 RepID=UPI003C5CB0D7
MRKPMMLATAAVLMTLPGAASAAEVKMLNQGTDGGMMVFEPAPLKIAPGDPVKFIATVGDPANLDEAKAVLPEVGKAKQVMTGLFDKRAAQTVEK